MSWQHSTDGSIRCERHDERFSPLAGCPGCAADPGIAPQGETEDRSVPAPDGCADLETHEREFLETAAFADGLARTLSNDTDKAGTVTKLLDVAIKARRAASSLAKDREDRVFVERLEKRRRDLTRGR